MKLPWSLVAAGALLLGSFAACSSDGGGGGGPAGDAGADAPTVDGAGPPVVTQRVVLAPAFAGIKLTGLIELVWGPRGFYALEQAGTIRRFAPGEATAATVMTIPKADIVAGGEAGLLGLAVHPKFAENGFVYVYYTAPTTTAGSPFKSVLARFRSSDGGSTLDLASRKVILEVDQPFPNHNGGKLLFGPDGFLYWSLGDGGSGGDPGNRAQDKDSLLGKILRIDVDAGDPYSIPTDNPFAAGGGKPEVFALGLRNAWKLAFDRDGVLWAGDVGQGKYEEVDRVVRGGNYGWRLREGRHCFEPATNCPTDGLIEPVAEYDHGQGISITGGYVYYGAAVPELVGKYVYGDYGSGRVWALHPPTGTVTVLNEEGVRPRISTFGQTPDGEIYVVDYTQGTLFRLELERSR